MALQPVQDYDVTWDPKTNRYGVAVFLSNGQRVVVPVNTEIEYVAVFAMLGKKGVLIDVQTGVLHLPRRPAGT